MIDLAQLDFSPDQLGRLDTGGRNWSRLYKNLCVERMTFSPSFAKAVLVPGQSRYLDLQCIDFSFCHIGGASYRYSDGGDADYLLADRGHVEECVRDVNHNMLEKAGFLKMRFSISLYDYILGIGYCNGLPKLQVNN